MSRIVRYWWRNQHYPKLKLRLNWILLEDRFIVKSEAHWVAIATNLSTMDLTINLGRLHESTGGMGTSNSPSDRDEMN